MYGFPFRIPDLYKARTVSVFIILLIYNEVGGGKSTVFVFLYKQIFEKRYNVFSSCKTVKLLLFFFINHLF